MSESNSFYGSSVGKKILMAVTGIILFGFVFVHMAGNLQFFIGAEELDRYSRFLHSVPEILWLVRLAVIFSFAVHIVAAIQVWWQSRKARPIKYRVRRHIATNVASRTMIWTGPLVLLFVVYHLLHLTYGTLFPELFQDGQVYHNIIVTFRLWPVALVYIIANLALGVHLYHGLWSLTQTLGWTHPRFEKCRRVVGAVLGIGVAAANISIPVSILAGWIH